MKISLRQIIAVLAATVGMMALAQARVSILGDSYSTFRGECTPAWNLTWYEGADGPNKKDNDVSEAEQTWWRQFIDNNGCVLEKNNSFSGSTICLTGYGGADYADRAFITRMMNLGNPDIIIVFGGTNDSWAQSPIGEYQYSGWTQQDLYSFRPAMACLLDGLKQLYPAAAIYNVTNSELSEPITASMQEICDHYGIPNIQLRDIDKQSGHPSQAGMKEIAKQLSERISVPK